MRLLHLYSIPIIACILSGIPLEVSAGVREDAETVIRQFYPGADELNFQTRPLDPAARTRAESAAGQSFVLDKLFRWEIHSGEAILGYAILDNVMGKAQPITYLILYTPDLKVNAVRVVRYREQYGGAIREPRWLTQFRGLDQHSGFEPGRHIDGISGATISVNAISRGIKRITVYVSLIANDAIAADSE